MTGNPDEILPTRNLMLLGQFQDVIPAVPENTGPVISFSDEAGDTPAPPQIVLFLFLPVLSHLTGRWFHRLFLNLRNRWERDGFV